MDEELPLPKVTPGMLRGAATMCARRLHAEFTGELGFGSEDPVNRARVRDALLDAVRVRHETGTASSFPPSLQPEERAVLEHALEWYAAMFGDDEDVTVELPLEQPTELPRRGVRLGGWVDLGITHADGSHELRQLGLGRGVHEDPLDDAAARMAVLRLVQTRWVTDGTLTVTAVDLLEGARAQRCLSIPSEIGPFGHWLDEHLDVVRERSEHPEPTPGRDCGQCRFVVGCGAHRVKGRMMTNKRDPLPSIVSITPTSLDSWDRCRREWWNGQVLGLPASDSMDRADHGLFVHDLLRFVHQTGDCTDEDHVNDVVASHSSEGGGSEGGGSEGRGSEGRGSDGRGSDGRGLAELRRHAERCPPGATALGHELDWARAGAEPPVFVATARLDAVWEHDGLLDVRDYKTGPPPDFALRDDRRARLQAWVSAQHAEARGLRLHLRYEHLSGDGVGDPEPWEPESDEIAAIEVELRGTVRDMRAERDFAGVRDAEVCGRCRYRSICPDSASPGTPSWRHPVSGTATVGSAA